MTDETQARTLLAQLGAALVGTGQPVNEVEEDLREVGRALGFPDAQIAAAATGVTLSLAVGSPSTFAVNPGNLRLDQASEVREIRHYLSRGRLDPVVAMERLATLRTQPARYPTWLENIGWVICAVGIALIIQPMWAGVTVAALGGVAVVALVRIAARSARLGALLPVAAAGAQEAALDVGDSAPALQWFNRVLDRGTGLLQFLLTEAVAGAAVTLSRRGAEAAHTTWRPRRSCVVAKGSRPFHALRLSWVMLTSARRARCWLPPVTTSWSTLSSMRSGRWVSRKAVTGSGPSSTSRGRR